MAEGRGDSWMLSSDACDARDGDLGNCNDRAVCRGGVLCELRTFCGEEELLSLSLLDADRLLLPSKSTPSSSPSTAPASSMSECGDVFAEASMPVMARTCPA